MRIVESQVIARRRRGDLPPGQVSVVWIGQAGFLIETGTVRLLIDPYLSDSLAQKYRGTKFPHARMMQPPVSAGELSDIDYLFATHGHSDHLDPGTLPEIQRANPLCTFVVPRSCRELAVERGVHPERLLTMNSEESIELTGGGSVTALPSAHEERKWDDSGNELFLGFLFRIAGRVIYHSGDGVPYEGLTERLRSAEIELFLMPVNGRDEVRRTNGVPGNFTLAEAYEIAHGSGGKGLIGHHYGMFEFNTIDPEWARAWIKERLPAHGLQCVLAELGKEYLLE
ncbi:MAG TPA: MBL fold metallo-hydrolase [Spirochaetia bacterium]|nr:MBL fold metallo-hydrolase [Spirochaetia bacterium]